MLTSKTVASAELAPTFARELLVREANSALSLERGKPDFFLVGAPKSGTTALAQFLSEHPNIFMPKKEMHTFGADLSFASQFYRRNLKEYLSEFDAWSHQQRGGEASVWYLFSTQAAREIHEFNPKASIILMLREPAEMLYSMYYQFRWDGNERLPTFAQALAAEGERRLGRGIPRQAHFAQGLVYRETARYTEQVRRYFKVFGRERVRVIIYDDFVADCRAVYRQTLEFLGVKETVDDPAFGVVNGNKSVRYRALRGMLNDPLLRRTILTLRPYMPRACFTALRQVDRWLWRLNTRFEPRPPLAPELRAQLKHEFAPEIERLSQLLDRDLTHWTR